MIKRLWRYLRPYWQLELITFLVMAVIAALELAIPIAIQVMIDDLIPNLMAEYDPAHKFRQVAIFGGLLVVVYLTRVLFSWWRDYLAGKIGANIIADIRSGFFNHLQQVPLQFYQTHQIGEIMSRILSDVHRIQYLLTSTLLIFLTDLLLLSAILIYLLNINWVLTLIALIPVPFTIVLSNRFGHRLHFITQKLQEIMAALSARLQEAFVSTRIIRAFVQERTEQKRVDDILHCLTGWYIKNSVTTSLGTNLVHFVNMIGPVVVLAWGTWLVAGGSIKLGALMAFYILLSYLYTPIQDLASTNIEFQSAMASVKRIFEYLDIPPAITEDPRPVVLSGTSGAISLYNVTFRYNGGRFKFKNLCLNIKPKEKIAIVGSSGSGKTTLINLIMRFLDPEDGIITLDGVPIHKISLPSLRRMIGLVDQEPLLFKATILDNIVYGRFDVSYEDIIHAAKIANIHEFICGLKRGYQHEVGERGITLSGGEKQRICLARALLTNPPILILDEATSSLDSNSEQSIKQALERVLLEKTAIIIAHRLSTVKLADRIITLDNGRISAEGTHEELMDGSPLYRELFSKQTDGIVSSQQSHAQKTP